MNGNTYFNFRFYFPLLFSGSRLGRPRPPGANVTSGVARRQSRVYFMDSSPIHRSWVQIRALHLQNRGLAEVLKRPFLPQKNVTQVRPPSEPEIPPPSTRLTQLCHGTCDFLPDITSETPCMGSYSRVTDRVQNSRAVLPTKGRSVL